MPHETGKREDLTPATSRAKQKLVKGLYYSAVIAPTLASAITVAEVLSKGGLSSGIGRLVDEHFGSSPSETTSEITFPVDQEGQRQLIYDEGLKRVLAASLKSSEEWQLYSQLQLQRLLESKQPTEAIEALMQMARNSVMGNVNLIQTARLLKYIPDRVDISSDYSTLRINQQNYDLKNQFHLQLANSWVHTRMMYLDQKILADTNRVPEEEREITKERLTYLDNEAKLLEWFRALNPQIVFREGSFVFFSQWEMVNMAKVFKVVAEQGYRIPDKFEWCASQCLDRYAANTIGVALTQENRAELKNTAKTETIAHEIAHLVAANEGLIARYTALRGFYGPDPIPNRLKYTSDYAMTSAHEDFAETFASYVISGEHFRRKLDQLRLHNPEAYAALNQKYDFMRNVVFKGVEFSSFAIRRDPDLEKKESDLTGIRLFPEQGNAIVIQPDPGLKISFEVFPILVGDRFENVFVSRNIMYYKDYKGEESHSYRVDIFPSGKHISKVTLLPLVGDKKVMSSSPGKLPSNGVEGIEINTQEAKSTYLSLNVVSLPK